MPLIALQLLTENNTLENSWASVFSVFMTTVGAVILALIKRDANRARVKAEETSDKVDYISKSVNNTPGDTLITRVIHMKEDQDNIKADLKEYQAWMGEAIKLIGKNVGVEIKPYEHKKHE